MLSASGDARFDLDDVDSQLLQSGDSRFPMGFAGLLVAPLVVALVLQFLLVSFSACGGLQASGREPGVRGAADLFNRQAIGGFAAGVVVLLTHPSTEQMAHLRQEKMTMQATPAAHLVVVHPQFVLGHTEATFHRPSPDGLANRLRLSARTRPT